MFLFIQWMGIWIILTILLSCYAKRLARRHRIKNREAKKEQSAIKATSDDEELLDFDSDATSL
tara:strand:- start:1179 stop:1367 length:189 start_codon:yes stop_codon:yes gene_type:complete